MVADLLSLAKRAVEVATGEGAEFADARASESRGLSVSVEKSSLHSTSDRQTAGVSVRAIVGGASGFAHDNRLTPEAVEETARRAVAAHENSKRGRLYCSTRRSQGVDGRWSWTGLDYLGKCQR